MKTSFAKIVKVLVKKILKEDFAIASSQVILAHVLDGEFEMCDIKFSNAQRICAFTDIDTFKQALFSRVSRSLFAYYCEAKQKVEIMDEPEGCDSFIIFRDHICESVQFLSILNSYFESVIVPVFNKRIADRLISLFGDDI
jgi:hypothetical protein